MFYLTVWGTNICAIALALLLMVVFKFYTLKCTIYDSKEIKVAKLSGILLHDKNSPYPCWYLPAQI